MALQIIPGGFCLPLPPGTALPPTHQNLLLDAADEKAAGIMQAPKTGTISKVGFATGTVTTGATVDVRLETVSLTNGDPTGTLLGTNSNGSQVIDAADDNTWFTVALTTGVAVTKGDILAAVVVNPSGSPGNLNIRWIRYTQGEFPYVDLFTASWVKTQGSPVFAFEYDDGSYAVSPSVVPVQASSNLTFNIDDTNDERGIKFKCPFPVRVTGMWAIVDLDGDCDIVLYDSDDTVLLSLSVDKDVRATAAQDSVHYTFSSTAVLSANVFRRLVFKPTTTTDIVLRRHVFDTAAILAAMPGGQDWHDTRRGDAGAWTDTTTQRPLMGLICDAFDAGGGGHANMAGGLQ